MGVPFGAVESTLASDRNAAAGRRDPRERISRELFTSSKRGRYATGREKEKAMTQVTQSQTPEVAAEKQGPPGQLCTIPLLGPTTIEDVAFYGVLGAVAVAELITWPTAALIGSAHALHQRARYVLQTQHFAGTERGEILEGTLEATEGIV